MPRIRAVPEDFLVEEIPLYEPSGEGHHTWCWVEKRLLTTEEAIGILAAAAGVPSREVGFAGRKDRRAVTRQWISAPSLDPAAAETLSRQGLRVLRASRHRHRLHLGDLLGNRFAVRVRSVSAEESRAAEEAWSRLLAVGMPNRFGPQRFGRDRGNPDRGRRLLAGERLPGSRRLARLFLSALQSRVFNEVLIRRPASLDAAMPGDLLLEHATGALHPVRDPGEWSGGLGSFRVSPTGPLFGPKMRRPSGAVAALEAQAMSDLGVPDPLPDGLLRRQRIAGERRPLRVEVREASLERDGDGILLRFVLPPGSYASILVEELFPGGHEEVRDTEGEDAV